MKDLGHTKGGAFGRFVVTLSGYRALCVRRQIFSGHTSADIWSREEDTFPIQDIFMGGGKGLYQALQFALVEYGQTQAILVYTDLSMHTEDIIEAYACCF